MYTPEGHRIEFKRDSIDCEGVPYMDLSATEDEVMLVKTESIIFRDIKNMKWRDPN